MHKFQVLSRVKFFQDIEDVCIAAVKEKDIEAKLKQVVAEWSVQDLTFSGIQFITMSTGCK